MKKTIAIVCLSAILFASCTQPPTGTTQASTGVASQDSGFDWSDAAVGAAAGAAIIGIMSSDSNSNYQPRATTPTVIERTIYRTNTYTPERKTYTPERKTYTPERKTYTPEKKESTTSTVRSYGGGGFQKSSSSKPSSRPTSRRK